MTFSINSQNDITEEFLMSLLCSAGEARSSVMAAMASAQKGDFEQASLFIDTADKALTEVHKTQTTLIGYDEGVGKVSMTLILTHIQDHIMTAMLCKDLALEIIAIHRKLGDLK
ncbi:PTS lactose/cellobiose transporter subunit IIA [Vibrio ezurae]|uniref:Putative phosphotransferase system enzyme IIA component n=1 Tax=Vibrio ezurae NBRC 102218 TaxID=1219080 RepID=U3CT58_9VIBR|nr:PTS lactose/cellobiose transporter subunit IIA [Vibrio ezurae]GAD80848.1 putative phosphotransferase system enzyme IIA component [Vibrio ezurae NBRC 102218]